MLLHSGSGLHRHEYSAPTSPLTSPITSTRTTLVRSAFSSPVPKTSTMRYDTSIKAAARPIRPSPDIRRNTGGVSFVEEAETNEEKNPEIMSDDEKSEEKSVASREGSETTFGGGRKRRKVPRTTTSYAFAHPAPTLLQKQQFVHLRPQLLLQLQRVSTSTRPVPILDVLPSAVFAPRLAKKCPVMFKGRGGLGPNDILCVKSENYSTSPDRASAGSDSDEDSFASREVEAVICQAKRGDARAAGQAEIVFSTGYKWTAVPLSSTIYEISSVDEHGLKTTVRWVRRSPRSFSDMRNKAPSTPSKSDTKFSFSVLDPRSRRHPVIATMTSNALDIPDNYTIPSPPAAPKSPASEEAASDNDNESILEEPQGKITHTVSESLRKLIRVTGVWVALRQGWCPKFKYDDHSPSSAKTPTTQTPTSNASSSNFRGRSVSLDYKTRHNNTDFGNLGGAETPESMQGSLSSAGVGGGGGFSGKLKRLSSHGHRSPKIMTDGGADIPTASVGKRGKPRRSASAGTAFMAKVAARRGGNPGPPSTVASDSDRESLGRSLDHSPPRRASTIAADVSRASIPGSGDGSRTNLNLGVVNDDGRKKRLSTPSPLRMDMDAIDASAHARSVSVSTLPASTNINSNPNTTTTTNASTSITTTEGKSSRGKEREKKGRWGRFISVFRRGH